MAFLAKEMDPNGKDADGGTLLHYAAARGYTDVIQVLVAAGASVNAREAGNHWTALHLAALSGVAGTVEALMSVGADPNARDDIGDTPLDYAVTVGDHEVLNVLLAYADSTRETASG